jgi:hypothetical protein
MSTSSTSRLQRTLASTAAIGLVLITGVGCQTFNLSEEDFQKQQRGQMVDPKVGEAVATAGTIGCVGALTGLAVAAAVKK